MTEPQHTLATLAERFVTAKLSESIAISERRAIGDQIVAMTAAPDTGEGSVTQREGGYKVTVTFGITRNINLEGAIAASADFSPEHMDLVIATKPAINTAGIRQFAKDEPVLYAQFAEHFTSKPSAPQITVDLIP